MTTPAEVPTTAGLGHRATRGAAVTIAGQAVRILVQVAGVVVLSRLLSPTDYGLLAMTTAVVGVADIFRDMGLSSAAVQAKLLTKAQRTNLWWINAAIGLTLSLVVFAAAPLLAAVYGRPELVEVTRLLCWTFLLNGLATQYRADLVRALRFGRVVVIDVVAPVVGLAVGVVAAMAGWGVTALVLQQLVQYGIVLALVALSAHWLPGLPDRRAPMGGLLRFGWQLVGSQLVGYAGNNVDSLVIGIRFGTAPLGLYNRAFQLLMTPLNQLRGPLTQVALPVLARLQDTPERVSSALQRGQAALGLTFVVGLGLLAGSAQPATALLLGPMWQEAAPLLALLAIAGALQTFGLVSYWAYLSFGLTGPLLRYSFIQAGVRIACVLGGSSFGVVGVAAGYALAPALGVGLSYWWLSRSVDVDRGALLSGAARQVAVAACGTVGSAVIAGSTAGLPAAVSLLLSLSGGAVVAVVAVCSTARTRADVVAVRELVSGAVRDRGLRDSR